MKYFASLCALLLVGSLPGFATSVHHTSINPQNQFHFTPSKHRAAQAATRSVLAKEAHYSSKQHGAASKMPAQQIQPHRVSGKNVRRHTAPTGKIGFLAATDIPSGGATWFPAYSGDFNNDGKTDIAGEVYAWDNTSSSYIFQISVVLSNGDGTFQQTVLTPISNNDQCAALLVGDVNGDGKSDILVGHNPGACSNSYTTPTIDVLLSKGDGTFTVLAGAITVNTSGFAGGTLALDSNGKLDLILVDEDSTANVFTLVGNGDGTFQPPTSIALGGEAGYDVTITDLDGDGILDFADIDYNTQQVAVYLSTSPTPFGTQALLDTPDHNHSACSLTAGDLNNDGYPELVTSNCSGSGNDITVYVNNGDGTGAFGGSTPEVGVYYDGSMSGGTNSAASDVETNAVTVADVNGDGKADIIATNVDSSDITVLLGKGDGTVSVPTVGYAIGGYPWNYNGIVSGAATTPAIVADFNGDGFADIIVPDQQFSYAYLRGYGDGTFRASVDYYAGTNSYSWTYGIASGDFNGDGHPDFVIGNVCGGCSTPMGITVFLSNPDGSLQPGVNFGSTSNFDYVAVADFDHDGKLDVAATDDSTGLVEIFTGDGAGNFAEGPSFNADLANNSPEGIFIGDFNNDGFPDLAIANSNGGDISILLNDKTGNFPTPVPILLNGSLSQGVAIADLRGIGNLDIVAPLTYGSGAIAVLLGNGDGTFQSEVDYPIGAAYPTSLTLADLDGNGTLDVAVTLGQGGGQDIAVALGNGDGTFGSFSTPVPSSLQDYNLTSSGPGPVDIVASDVDGDGYPDLVYTNAWYGTVGILFGQGNGAFFDPVEYPVGQTSWGFTTADVNGDGRSDVVAASYDFAGVNVLLNLNGANALGSYTIKSSANGKTVAAGSTATFTLTITPKNHYNGTVTFACPAGLPSLATCSFSPSSVTLDGLNAQTVTLTITTKAPSTSKLRTRASLDPQDTPRPRSSAMLLASLNGVGVFGLFLAGSLKKRARQSLLAVLALGMLFFLVGCGGSSNSDKATTSTVTSSNATSVVGQSVTFTGSVTAASGTPSGSITFLDGTSTLGTGTLSGGSATFQTSSLAAGVHSITISYAGDSSFNASTSQALTQTVDKPGTPPGTYGITVTGTGSAGTNGVGSATQSINVNVTVQ